MKSLTGVTILLILLSGAVIFTHRSHHGPETERAQFTLPFLDSEEVLSSRDLKGLTLLHFWASWCERCDAELPFLRSLANVAQLSIVGIATRDDLTGALRKAKELPYKSLYDPDGEVFEGLGLSALPASVLVNGAGEVLLRVPRALNHPQIVRISDLIRRI